MAKSDKLYGDSPTLERDEESGKVEAKRPKRDGAEEKGVEGMPPEARHRHERREMKHRHLNEHMALHHRHEIEHAHHDEGKGGHKGALHERHERELEELHSRHHKDVKAMHDRHEKEMKEGGGEKERRAD